MTNPFIRSPDASNHRPGLTSAGNRLCSAFLGPIDTTFFQLSAGGTRYSNPSVREARERREDTLGSWVLTGPANCQQELKEYTPQPKRFGSTDAFLLKEWRTSSLFTTCRMDFALHPLAIGEIHRRGI